MGTTTGGFSWPATTAPIRDGATAIRTLAEQVEARYGVMKLCAKMVVVTTNASGDISINYTGITNCLGAVVTIKTESAYVRVTTLSVGGVGIGCRVYSAAGAVMSNWGPIELHALMWGT